MDRERNGLTLLPYKASRQLLQISYVSIFVVPPKLLDVCATFMGNIIFTLCKDQLFHPYREHRGKKKPLRVYDSSGKALKKKKLKKRGTYRDKLSTEAAIY